MHINHFVSFHVIVSFVAILCHFSSTFLHFPSTFPHFSLTIPPLLPQIWSTRTFTCLSILQTQQHVGEIFSLAFFPGLDRLFFGCQNASLLDSPVDARGFLPHAGAQSAHHTHARAFFENTAPRVARHFPGSGVVKGGELGGFGCEKGTF